MPSKFVSSICAGNCLAAHSFIHSLTHSIANNYSGVFEVFTQYQSTLKCAIICSLLFILYPTDLTELEVTHNDRKYFCYYRVVSYYSHSIRRGRI